MQRQHHIFVKESTKIHECLISNIVLTSHLAWYSRMWMSNVQYHANFTLPIWRTMWGPCFCHKGAMFWPFLGMGAMGYTQQCEIWHGTSLGTLIRIQEKSTLLTKHVPHMVLQMGSSWFLINMPGDAPCQISHCWVYLVAPFPRNGQNMALYGKNMVLTWSFKLVLSES